MGAIKNLIKTGANQSLNRLKNYDVGGKMTSAIESAGFDIPKVEMPDQVKEMKLNIDPSIIKPPAGMTNYISPLLEKGLSLTGVKLPSEIGGVELPTLPDLSSVSSKVDEYVSGLGIDTEALGIRNVSDILKEPDLKSITKVPSTSPVDYNNLPDINSAMDGFNMDSIQSEIDSLTSQIPGASSSFDLSKIF